MDKAQAASELLVRRRARASLIDYASYIKPDYQAATHHRRIAEALEAVERGDCHRLMVEAPPRHGKSELTSRLFPSWAIGRNPRREIIMASYAGELAHDMGRDVRSYVNSQEFAAAFPGVSLRADSKAVGRWHTNHGGAYFAVGVGGPLTGRGGDIALIDDPFKDHREAYSELRRKRVWDWFTTVFLSRLAPRAPVVLTNTRWHEDDLSGRIIARAKQTGEHWEVLKLPALSADGEALWPERYPSHVLERMRDTMIARDWYALYQQQPTAEEGLYFERQWFEPRYQRRPDVMTIYMTADFALSTDKGDYTEIGVWGVTSNRQVFALDWWYGQTDSATWANEVLRLNAQWAPLLLISERDNIEKAVEPWLRREMSRTGNFLTIKKLSAAGDKQAKARNFQAMQSTRSVYWPETPWAERVIDQCLRFPNGTHDDAVDACGLIGRYCNHLWGASAQEPKDTSLEAAIAKPLSMNDLYKTKGRQTW